MNKKASVAVFLTLIILFSASIAVYFARQPQASPSAASYTYKVVNTYTHDTAAYTEGLLYSGGYLYESTGQVGTSWLRKVNLESGEVLKQVDLGGELYGEGLTQVGDTLVQLTWRNHVGFVYDKDTFALLSNFTVASEGWGLTYDGSRLILSDGSARLYFLYPSTHQVVGQVIVKDGNQEVTKINELEYVGGDVYANIWQTTNVAIINPLTGQVKGWIDLSGLHQSQGPDDVLNGIAYDSQTGRLFVTGKNWPSLYQIELTPKT